MRCAVCGTEVNRPQRSDRRPACTVECRTILEHGHSRNGEPYDWGLSAMKRAAAAGATQIEYISQADVFVRDGWICYLCGEPTDQGVDALHPDSPTVDHVLALSIGGQHVRNNVATAHLRCNSSKQDRSL